MVQECPIYQKHHNIINGVYMVRQPKQWEEICEIDNIDADDEDGQLNALLNDLNVYFFDSSYMPYQRNEIVESIYIIRRNGRYYLCESQGEKYVKFSVDISKLIFIKDLNRRLIIEHILIKLNSEHAKI